MKLATYRLVIERHRRLRDAAAAEQAQVRGALDGARQTLGTLAQYRDEQQERLRNRTGAVSVGQLAVATRFAGTLDEAIRLQQQRVDELAARIARLHAAVLHEQVRLKALEAIERRRREDAARMRARREQQALDERAATRHAHSARPLSPVE